MSKSVLLSCEDVSKRYGARPLFEGVTFGLMDGDHVGLVGPNGSGKSTLLRILAGHETPDSGQRIARRGIRVGYVAQDPEFDLDQTCEEVLLAALRGDKTHHHDEHENLGLVVVALGKAGIIDREQKVAALSGGWRKRLAIARELVMAPDVLLMDEPTNHLDVEGIIWLEQLLKSEPEAFLVVSHDRYFLENISKRMIELNRIYPKGIFEAGGTYSDFLEAREAAQANQQSEQETLANLVRREIEWLRRGPKARTTKAKARIQNAGRLIDELDDVRSRNETRTASIDFTASERKTKRLWSGKGLGFDRGERTLFNDLDLLLSPQTRLGILGPNGSGKTTLLRVISGELQPDRGTVEKADWLRIVYFQQNRDSLDPDLSLKRTLAPDGDTIIFRDKPQHVIGWAKRFLFRPEQLETPVGKLSGGERARIFIARLMLQPADLLILDEPTNDLDIPTLEVLEESLLDFPGAIVLVTHDRYLLDRVSTSILAIDGEGGAEQFADYDQWVVTMKERFSNRASAAKAATAEAKASAKTKKLGYLEQRELDSIEERVAKAEEALTRAEEAAADPAIATDAAALQKRFTELAEARAEVDRVYARWAELEAKTK